MCREQERERLLCEVVTLNLKTKKTRIEKIWCTSFYEVYGRLMRENKRMISYRII